MAATSTPQARGEVARTGPEWVRPLIQAVFRPYFAVWHGLELRGRENLPPTGPLLALANHGSVLDPPALLLADPYPRTLMFAKASLFEVPLIGWCLRDLGAVPVERQGRDLAGLRAALYALRAGRVVAAAAEGRRTRSGHLEAINPVLARVAVVADVPILPIGIAGSFAALPPGAWLPRHRKIVIRFGKPFRLARGTETEAARQRIQDEIAALLPPEQQPVSG
jgi:1-acyl-sn-glycerol-3-phosphate acyltransferase